MTAVAAAFLFIKVSFNGTNAVIPLSNDSIGGDSGGVRYPFFQICSTFAVTCDRPTAPFVPLSVPSLSLETFVELQIN